MTNKGPHSVISALVALAFAASPAFAAGTHPVIGTWQLNLAKSTDEGTLPPPKSETFIFAGSDKGTSLATKIVGADGKVSETKGPPIKWDGMPHPENTNPDHDAVTVKSVGVQTIEWAFTKKGVLVRSGTLTVSRDGKMMTVSGASVGAKGEKTYFNDIFDRQ
jgi:hypothetical protein